MKRIILLFTIASCAVIPQLASGADAGVEVYEVKNRSTFRVQPDARAPFWPIGWQRPAKGSTSTGDITPKQATIQLEPRHFNVASILLGNPALATINGRSFAEGEALPVVFGKQRLRVVVRSIRDGGVWLDHEGQQIFVPVHRPELGAKQATEMAEPVEFTIKINSGEK